MKPKRNSKGHFLKGESGNLSGRPVGGKGLAEYIRSISNNLFDYVDILDKAVKSPNTKFSDKIYCIRELLDRSLGKAAQTIHQTGDLDIVIGNLPEGLDNI